MEFAETETEPELDLETETLIVESERLRGEIEEELMFETEPMTRAELELPLRTELDFFQELEAEGIGVETVADPIGELGREIEQIGEAETILETETELVTELVAEQEQIQELELVQEAELEPREVEVEPFGVELDQDDEDVFEPFGFRGVRAVEAELRPTELDLD